MEDKNYMQKENLNTLAAENLNKYEIRELQRCSDSASLL